MKRIFDLVVSFFFIVLFLPLMGGLFIIIPLFPLFTPEQRTSHFLLFLPFSISFCQYARKVYGAMISKVVLLNVWNTLRCQSKSTHS